MNLKATGTDASEPKTTIFDRKPAASKVPPVPDAAKSPMHPDDPANMVEEELVYKMSTGRKAFWWIAAIVTVIALIFLVKQNLPAEKVVVTKLLPGKEKTVLVDRPVPTIVEKHKGRPVPATVKFVAMTDLSPCKKLSVIKLSNGNTRITGTECETNVLPAAPAQAETAPPAPPEPAATTPAVTAPAATTSTTAAVQVPFKAPEAAIAPAAPADAQAKVEAVINEASEEIRAGSEAPEGAIETTELESASSTPSEK